MYVESLIALTAMEWVGLWTLNVACYRHASIIFILTHGTICSCTNTIYKFLMVNVKSHFNYESLSFINHLSHCHICVINAVFSLISVHLSPSKCICPHSSCSCDRLPKYDTNGQHSDVLKWTATTCPARWVVRIREW